MNGKNFLKNSGSPLFTRKLPQKDIVKSRKVVFAFFNTYFCQLLNIKN